AIDHRGEQVRVGREQQRRSVEESPVERGVQLVEQGLDLPQVEQLERILDRLSGRQEVEIAARDLLDHLFERRLAEQVVGDPRTAVELQKVVQRRTAEIEIGDQDRIVGQVRFGQGQVHRGER